jgi:hypothetical protein
MFEWGGKRGKDDAVFIESAPLYLDDVFEKEGMTHKRNERKGEPKNGYWINVETPFERIV